MKAVQRLMLTFIASGVLVSQSECQILPGALCSGCASLFRIAGCFERETPICRAIATKLRFGFGENLPLCIEFPCEGYGQTNGYQCTTLLGCPLASIDPNGLCPSGRRCCTNPRS